MIALLFKKLMRFRRPASALLLAMFLPWSPGCEKRLKSPELAAHEFIHAWLAELKSGVVRQYPLHGFSGQSIPVKKLSGMWTAGTEETSRPFDYQSLYHWEMIMEPVSRELDRFEYTLLVQEEIFSEPEELDIILLVEEGEVFITMAQLSPPLDSEKKKNKKSKEPSLLLK